MGATYIFGGQKGLSPSQVKKVDQNMAQFYQGFAPEVPKLAGSCAGGGMAAGMVAFAGAEIKSGIVLYWIVFDFDQRVKTAVWLLLGKDVWIISPYLVKHQ